MTYLNNTDDAFSLVVNNAGHSNQNDRGVFEARVGTNSVFRINNSGNVGIGTTDPVDKLQVSALGYGFRHYGDASNYLRTYAGSGYQILDNGTNQFGYFGGKFYVQTGGTDKFYIDASGNLGLGVTPSAWASATRALQVGTYGALAWSGGVDISMTNNAYYDGTDWVYIASQEAGRFLNNRNTFAWYQAAAGTAGAAITFTQAMTLDASGELGIGETSPSAKLDVVGSTELNGALTQSGGDVNFDSGTLFVDAANNRVGIGTTNPVSGDFVVKNGSNTDLEFFSESTGFALQAYNRSTNTGGYLRFIAGSGENMRIHTNGNVGIGTPSPSAKLDVVGDIVVQNQETNTNAAELNLYKKNGSSSGDVTVGDNIGNINFKAENGATTVTSASIEVDATTVYNNEIGGDMVFKTASEFHSRPLTEAMRIDKLGNISLDSTLFVDATNNRVGIGITSPSVELDVIGDIEYTGTITDVSDEKLKINKEPLLDATSKLMLLNPIKYNQLQLENNKLGNTEYGFTAQDVRKVYPEMVRKVAEKDGVDYLGLSYIQLISPIIKGFQEQQAIIETQATEIEQLKTLITELSNRLTILENK
jgi:hypothetical protein